jgi:hypothetical protein
VVPGLEWQGRRSYGLVSAALTGFEGSAWVVQGRGEVSLVAEPFGLLSPLRAELVAGAYGTYHSSEFRTALSRADARLQVAGSRLGAWVSGTGATGWASSDGEFVTAVGGTAGSWTRARGLQAVALVSALRIEGTWFPEVGGRLLINADRVDLTMAGGWRAGEGDVEADAWGGLNATLWLGRHVAVTAAGGWYPADLLQGLPRGQYVSAGIRLASRRAETPSLEPLARPMYVERGGVRTLRFTVRNAQRVAFVSEWNHWEAIPLEPVPAEPGVWILAMDLPPGVHRFNLVVDGDRWIVPEGVMTVSDGFGGEVGLLIVPGNQE